MSEGSFNRAHKVEVFLGGGGDRDELATFLVWAITPGSAAEEARKAAAAMLNTEAEVLAVAPQPDDYVDYDNVLTAPRSWHHFEGEDPDSCALCGHPDDNFEVHIKEMSRRYGRRD